MCLTQVNGCIFSNYACKKIPQHKDLFTPVSKVICAKDWLKNHQNRGCIV